MIPILLGAAVALSAAEEKPHRHPHIAFDIVSVRSGDWSDAATWDAKRVPHRGDRVRVSRGTTVTYDVKSDDVIRLVQVVGTLRFSRDRDTVLNVGLLKVLQSDTCSEDGFECDFADVNPVGGPPAPRGGTMPTLEIGTSEEPIPAGRTVRVRLHHVDGLDANDAPALICCSARMELHGTPMSRTWVKLGRTAEKGDTSLTLGEPVTGWSVGDEVIITGGERGTTTEERRIKRIDGTALELDEPLGQGHVGEGEFRCEVANLSRNVVIESADPDGVRGHTMYHALSRGGISYARFASLGKRDVLGRYPVHYHLIADTMRGSQVLGVSITDSHNRWVTVHGTEYLVVRDCVGYQSVGHGFFMEDGTEVYNLFDRNLGVGATRGKRLPDQVLPFDPNEGGAFWWANGRNTIVRNVACENDEYGFRYDMQNSKYFSSTLRVLGPDGRREPIDVRTIANWRFEDNETHTEGLYGVVIASNGNKQPDSPIQNEGTLKNIRSIDWTGPDKSHPHVIRGLKVWNAHYSIRPHSPSMLMEDLRIHGSTYGIYRPAFENQVYRDLKMSGMGSEPFNRGMDDASAQFGKITVDGFHIDAVNGNDPHHPVIHMTDNDLSGEAECHFRNVTVGERKGKRALFNRGGGVRVDPFVDDGVPYYLHDHFGPGRDALIVSTKAKDLFGDGAGFRSEPPLTGNESRITEVKDVPWPELLTPVDDLPPATAVTSVGRHAGKLLVRGITHDNGTITRVEVNGRPAKLTATGPGVVDWEAEVPGADEVVAFSTDDAGNVERTAHRLDSR